MSTKEHVPSTNPPEGTREGKLASTYYSRRHYPEDIPVVPRFPTFETYETEYRFSAVRITLPVYSQAYGANFERKAPSLVRANSPKFDPRSSFAIEIASEGELRRESESKGKGKRGAAPEPRVRFVSIHPS